MTDEHLWDRLADAERRDLARVLGDAAARAFDARPVAERATLRCLRLSMAGGRVACDLWREVREVVWASPNQAGLVVRDAGRFHELARDAVRPDGSPVFRPDPTWLLRLFKHGAEWSLRERGVARWGLQLYRRGRSRRFDGEIVADLDAVPLAAGAIAHMRDVVRSRGQGADPLEAWRSLVARE